MDYLFANHIAHQVILRLSSARGQVGGVAALLPLLVCGTLCPTKRFACLNGRELTCVTDEKDLVIIGGGVAGYVAAIKAGQEGMKVRL